MLVVAHIAEDSSVNPVFLSLLKALKQFFQIIFATGELIYVSQEETLPKHDEHNSYLRETVSNNILSLQFS